MPSTAIAGVLNIDLYTHIQLYGRIKLYYGRIVDLDLLNSVLEYNALRNNTKFSGGNSKLSSTTAVVRIHIHIQLYYYKSKFGSTTCTAVVLDLVAKTAVSDTNLDQPRVRLY